MPKSFVNVIGDLTNMAVILYKKDGQSIIVPPDRLQANLKAGWSLTKGENNAEKKEEKIPTTTKEIRQFAKLAGFKDWRTAKIQILREKLGYED